jgi:hypothetical protein
MHGISMLATIIAVHATFPVGEVENLAEIINHQ